MEGEEKALEAIVGSTCLYRKVHRYHGRYRHKEGANVFGDGSDDTLGMEEHPARFIITLFSVQCFQIQSLSNPS